MTSPISPEHDTSLVSSASHPKPHSSSSTLGEPVGEWIVPDLVYRGEHPPRSEKWKLSDWVEQPHYAYIPVTHARFVQALQDTPEAKSVGQPFHDFLELLGLLYHVHYFKTLRELKEDYEYFSASTGEEARRGVPESELLLRERRFLSNFIRSMVRGNFQPFREKEYQQSLRNNYLFDLPVTLDWEAYDERLFENFHTSPAHLEALRQELNLQGSIDEYLQLPEAFHSRIWTFFRGGGREQIEGIFLPNKIDLWISRTVQWVVWPFQWVIEKVRGDEVQHSKETMRAIRNRALRRKKKSSDTGEFATELSDPNARNHIFEKRWIRHLNLENQPLPLKDLLQPKIMQEPTFHRIISLYRLHVPPQLSWWERIPGLNRLLKRKQDNTQREKDWTIFIKLFREIPMADSEMIFPARKLRMKSSDLAILVMTGLVGVYGLIRSIRQHSSFLLIVFLGLLSVYVVKLILGYRRVKQRYQALVTHTLYHKNLDNDMGVLEFLVSSMEEQDLKESALVYFVLWRAQRPMTLADIDAEVEAFLHEKFEGLEVDFEVEDALHKVEDQGKSTSFYHVPLVQRIEEQDGQARYVAVPLEQALSVMDALWDNMYQAKPVETAG